MRNSRRDAEPVGCKLGRSRAKKKERLRSDFSEATPRDVTFALAKVSVPPRAREDGRRFALAKVSVPPRANCINYSPRRPIISEPYKDCLNLYSFYTVQNNTIHAKYFLYSCPKPGVARIYFFSIFGRKNIPAI